MNRHEINLGIGDKIIITTPYGEMFISIPHDDYGWE